MVPFSHNRPLHTYTQTHTQLKIHILLGKRTEITFSFKRAVREGWVDLRDLTQNGLKGWLACVRSWVPFPAPKKNKNKQTEREKYRTVLGEPGMEVQRLLRFSPSFYHSPQFLSPVLPKVKFEYSCIPSFLSQRFLLTPAFYTTMPLLPLSQKPRFLVTDVLMPQAPLIIWKLYHFSKKSKIGLPKAISWIRKQFWRDWKFLLVRDIHRYP